MHRTVITAGALAALGLSFLTGPASAVPVTELPQPRKDMRPVLWCQSTDELNCIESVEYEIDGEWRETTIAEVLDWGGKPVPVLNTEGLAHEGGRTQIIAEVFERYDVDGNQHPAYQLQIQSWPQDSSDWPLEYWDPPVNRCVDGNPEDSTGTDPCWRAPWLADANYRMTFRSSRLQPILAMASITDMQTTYEDIAGGVRFTLAGRPGPSQWTLDRELAEQRDTADGITYEWGGLVTDARGANGLGADCAGLGITTVYSNGGGGQMPKWDTRTGSLSYGVSGMHYAPDGSLYKGQAQIFVPGPLARCLWKIDPRQTARMEIEVFTENGEESVGTKAISYDASADLVRMIAIEFTYSRKEIAARPTPVAVQPGTSACNAAKTVCVTVDKKRKAAKVTLTKVKRAKDITAVSLRGTREDGRTQVATPVRNGAASLTIRLSGKKSKGQVWLLRTSSTFISSFQVG